MNRWTWVIAALVLMVPVLSGCPPQCLDEATRMKLQIACSAGDQASCVILKTNEDECPSDPSPTGIEGTATPVATPTDSEGSTPSPMETPTDVEPTPTAEATPSFAPMPTSTDNPTPTAEPTPTVEATPTPVQPIEGDFERYCSDEPLPEDYILVGIGEDLHSALQNAPDGATVCVEPGEYVIDNVSLDERSLRVSSTSESEFAVLVSSYANHFTAMNGSNLQLQGVWLTAGNGYGDDPRATRGGAIYSIGSNVSLNMSRVQGNFAGVSGGGIYMEEGSLELLSSVIQSNYAPDYGGGAYLRQTSLNVEASVFRDNYADYGCEVRGVFGGYSASITNSNFEVTERCAQAGLELDGGIVTISGSSITNVGDGGSRIGLNLYEGTLNMTSSRVIGFQSYSYSLAGGLHLDNVLADIADSVFRGNVGYSLGGAIGAIGGRLKIVRSIFDTNQANSWGAYYGRGAAVHATQSSSTIVHNCLFVGNHSRSQGGGIYLYRSYLYDVTNSTFLYNSAAGGLDIYANQSGDIDGTIQNSLFASDNGEETPSSVSLYANTSSQEATFWYNAFASSTNALYGQDLNDSNVIGDPLVDDYWGNVEPTSPTIDAGHPDPDYHDLDGSRNDIGCYGGQEPLILSALPYH